ncbi:hypothetical protein B7494_g8536 [Chlorociboria aeruginascens]|nr:hypothetical protein B7494_g8536 [Chlorociboria aeruginascens]
MQFSYAALVAVAAALVAAESPSALISKIPSCGLPALVSSIQSAGCSNPADFSCSCSKIAAIKSAAFSSVTAACGSSSDASTVFEMTEQICDAINSGRIDLKKRQVSSSAAASTIASSTSGATPTTSAPATSSTVAASNGGRLEAAGAMVGAAVLAAFAL